MSYVEILNKLKNNVGTVISDVDAVNMVAEAFVTGAITEEEKEKLFDFIY